MVIHLSAHHRIGQFSLVGGGHASGMADEQREPRMSDDQETVHGADPSSPETTVAAVVRMLANPRRTRRL